MHLKYREIIKKSIPVMLTYTIIGFNFGLLFKNIGGSTVESFMISLFTFAGAAQYLSLEYYSNFSVYGIMFLTIVIINLRHILYTTLSLDNLNGNKFIKYYLISAMTDENYATLTLFERSKLTQLDIFKIFSINHFYWITGCTAGSLIELEKINIKGLDFLLLAMFAVIATSKLQSLIKGLR